MSSIGTGYDLSASQFSPDGRVFQVDYAAKAVENNGTAIALRGRDGVVFAVEKIVQSKLFESNSCTRIFTVDDGIGLTFAGVMADGRALVEVARQEASNYRMLFNKRIPIKLLNDRLTSYLHAYTLFSAVRPFGASIMLSSWSQQDGAELYMLEPSGFSCGYYGCAIGKAKQTAKNNIESLIDISTSGSINLKPANELLNEAAKIIYEIHDSARDKDFLLELSWVGEMTGGLHVILDSSDQLYIDAKQQGEQTSNEDRDDGEDDD